MQVNEQDLRPVAGEQQRAGHSDANSLTTRSGSAHHREVVLKAAIVPHTHTIPLNEHCLVSVRTSDRFRKHIARTLRQLYCLHFEEIVESVVTEFSAES